MFRFIKFRFPAFKHAFAGVAYVLKTQKNAWIHSAATFLVLLLAFLLKLSPLDFAILVLAIGLVWLAEILNTSIEAVTNLVSLDQHPLAKIAKDAGAAAVLVAAIVSIVIGILVLGPPLIATLHKIFTR